jgi:hypothetical protein
MTEIKAMQRAAAARCCRCSFPSIDQASGTCERTDQEPAERPPQPSPRRSPSTRSRNKKQVAARGRPGKATHGNICVVQAPGDRPARSGRSGPDHFGTGALNSPRSRCGPEKDLPRRTRSSTELHGASRSGKWRLARGCVRAARNLLSVSLRGTSFFPWRILADTQPHQTVTVTRYPRPRNGLFLS